MFLLPSILLGFVFALLLGGRPSRLLNLRFRATWTVFGALAVQLVLFSDAAEVPRPLRAALHIGSYVLLAVFALANRRLVALAPAMLGMFLNGAAIAANGGSMPILDGAARAAGLQPESYENVSERARHLVFLGDVFSVPSQLPLSNAFSVGDLLICFGMIAFIVSVSFGDDRLRLLSLKETLAPLRRPSYRRLIGGKLVSSIGDWLTLAALISWQYERTGSTTAVAATLLARLAPPIVGGGVAAYLVDRMPKGRLLSYVELGRGLTVLCALAGVVEGSMAVVLGALALSGLLASISNAGTPALLPTLVPAGELASANAGLGLVVNGAMALGAGAAGLALAATQVGVALVVDAVSFAVAAALFARLRIPAADRAEVGQTKEKRNAPRYLLRKPTLLVLVLAFSVATFATGLTNATLPQFLGDFSGLGEGGYAFGIAALAAGLALGEIMVGFSRVGPAAGRWIGAGLLLTGGLLATLAIGHHGPSILLLLGLIGFVDGSTDILYDLAIQRGADPSYYGAVFGFSAASMSTTMVAAFALAPLLGRILPTAAVIGVGAAAFVVAGIVALTAVAVSQRATAEPGAVLLKPAEA
jgi:hypothetical protein